MGWWGTRESTEVMCKARLIEATSFVAPQMCRPATSSMGTLSTPTRRCVERMTDLMAPAVIVAATQHPLPTDALYSKSREQSAHAQTVIVAMVDPENLAHTTTASHESADPRGSIRIARHRLQCLIE